MRTFLCGIMILAALPAVANDQGEIIRKQVERCWSVPPNISNSQLTVQVKFEINENGEAKNITVIDVPEGTEGHALTLSATRAIERCSPYIGVTPDTVYITFKADLL